MLGGQAASVEGGERVSFQAGTLLQIDGVEGRQREEGQQPASDR